jgi:hypothetical protein
MQALGQPTSSRPATPLSNSSASSFAPSAAPAAHPPPVAASVHDHSLQHTATQILNENSPTAGEVRIGSALADAVATLPFTSAWAGSSSAAASDLSNRPAATGTDAIGQGSALTFTSMLDSYLSNANL